MGMQEYIVSKKFHKIEEFISIIGKNHISCVTIPKKDIKGTILDIKVDMNKDEEYVVLYGDRHDLRDLLYEHFPNETFFGSECANEIALGNPCPSRDEMSSVFSDILIDAYLQKLTCQ